MRSIDAILMLGSAWTSEVWWEAIFNQGVKYYLRIGKCKDCDRKSAGGSQSLLPFYAESGPCIHYFNSITYLTLIAGNLCARMGAPHRASGYVSPDEFEAANSETSSLR